MRVCLLLPVLLAVTMINPPLYAAGKTEETTDSELAAAKAHFAREKAADTRWYYGWLGFSTTVLATATTLYFTAEKDSRIQKAQPISMTVSSIGLVSLMLLKPKSFAASEELAALPETTLAEKKAKLRRSEYWLEHAAAQQRFTTRAFAHVSTVTFLGLASLIDALWVNGPGFALLRFVTSLAVAEFKISTQPTYSRDLADSRKSGEPLAWDFKMTPGEIALVAYF